MGSEQYIFEIARASIIADNFRKVKCFERPPPSNWDDAFLKSEITKSFTELVP